jgi:cobalt-zinc-cadmium efflux system protein
MVVGYMIAEVIGGVISGSLALLADAGHMLSDAGALVVTLLAFRFARRPASETHTFGYRRAEILAALANGVALVAIAGYVLYGAYHRLADPVEVLGPTMLAIASGGLVVNLISLALLHRDASGNLNIRGAWLHVVADAIGSIGAIIAGVLITAFGWSWADPLASVLIALLVLVSAFALLRQVVDVLMQAVPAGVDLAGLRGSIEAISGVVAVHDLHVWSVTSDEAVMSAHVAIERSGDRRTIVESIERDIGARYGLTHVTIQTDCREDCAPCPKPASELEAETIKKEAPASGASR